MLLEAMISVEAISKIQNLILIQNLLINEIETTKTSNNQWLVNTTSTMLEGKRFSF
jgi:hypothetical protein